MPFFCSNAIPDFGCVTGSYVPSWEVCKTCERSQIAWIKGMDFVLKGLLNYYSFTSFGYTRKLHTIKLKLGTEYNATNKINTWMTLPVVGTQAQALADYNWGEDLLLHSVIGISDYKHRLLLQHFPEGPHFKPILHTSKFPKCFVTLWSSQPTNFDSN